ncbi:hypothetical protein GA0061099_102023 [Bradyrhizobium yuanmingense]|uniref:Uncharacterized protein n=1 Tax=Bradyrhizobium yuanmingense TaxID=108015 RepID=A0A1C3XH77_9BRAD|nr:hypothetical protein IQ15_07195 [Bradyrhizobium yuanmingense]SCB51620.1 hypothetical protein GA0061099_102023 [Bradyrhizobium yuanmingense]
MTMLFPQTWRAGLQRVSAAIDDNMGEPVLVMLGGPTFPESLSLTELRGLSQYSLRSPRLW